MTRRNTAPIDAAGISQAEMDGEATALRRCRGKALKRCEVSTGMPRDRRNTGRPPMLIAIAGEFSARPAAQL